MKREKVEKGIFRHYKGSLYEVLGVAEYTETGEAVVVYKALYGERKLWVKPVDNFCDVLKTKKGSVLRFKYLGSSREEKNRD